MVLTVSLLAVLASSWFTTSLAQSEVVPPTVVGRGERTKRCPPDFQDIGKECIRVVTQAAQPQCPPNSSFSPDGLCAIYSGKSPSCPTGFTLNGSSCARQGTATPSQHCSTGFTLTVDNNCVAPVVQTPKYQCPGGSVRRGDLCLTGQEELPELTCPPGYTLDGKACRIEELYNCTPPREDLPPPTETLPGVPPPPTAPTPARVPPPPTALTPARVPPPPPPTILPEGQLPQGLVPSDSHPAPESYRAAESNRARAALGMNYVARGSVSQPLQQQQQQRVQQQQQLPLWRRGQALLQRFVPLPQGIGKEFTPELIDYVVQATCKRIRTIAAQKLCARGLLNGKTCRVEVEVPPVATLPNAMEYDVRPPFLECPSGFTLSSPTLCRLSEIADILYVCPEGIQDVGDRCASFTPPSMTCPTGFVLESDINCVQTLHAAPLTEFTVRYACVGKDCENQ